MKERAGHDDGWVTPPVDRLDRTSRISGDDDIGDPGSLERSGNLVGSVAPWTDGGVVESELEYHGAVEHSGEHRRTV